MLRYEIELSGAETVSKALGEERERLRSRMTQSALAVAMDMRTEALRNLSGGVLRRRGVINDLAQYVNAQIPVVSSSEVTWGLPLGGEAKSGSPQGETLPMSRIGAFFEKGGTVKPVRAKMLRIPLSNGPALTAAGYDRYAGVQLRSAAKGQFRVQKTLGGKLFLVKDVRGTKTGRGARAEIWYRLVYSATVRPHPWFRKAFEVIRGRLPGVVSETFKETT